MCSARAISSRQRQPQRTRQAAEQRRGRLRLGALDLGDHRPRHARALGQRAGREPLRLARRQHRRGERLVRHHRGHVVYDSDMLIRAATPDDAAPAPRSMRRTSRTPRSASRPRRRRRPRWPSGSPTAIAWFVLEDDGRSPATPTPARFHPRAAYRWACEVSVYLEPGRRRTGAGRALYDVLLRHLAERGYRPAIAGMTLPNPASEACTARSASSPSAPTATSATSPAPGTTWPGPSGSSREARTRRKSRVRPPTSRCRGRQRERQRLAVVAGAQRLVGTDDLLERDRHRVRADRARARSAA